MADKKKMSVEDILAACRKVDSGGGASADSSGKEAERPATPPSTERAPAAASSPAGVSEGASEAAKKSGPMSTADILAAARAGKKDAGGSSDQAAGAQKPASPEKPAGLARPAAGGAAAKPGSMSVADILAAARAGKGGGAGAASGEKSLEKSPKEPAAKAAPKPRPAAAAADRAEKSGAPDKAAAAGPKDTASILAAARKPGKPGPVPTSTATATKPAAAESRAARAKVEVPPMPARPGYARPAAVGSAAAQPARRGFLAAFLGILVASPLAIGFSSLAVTHLLWALGLARFMFPNVLTEPPTRFKVGFPDEFAPGQVEEKFKAQFGVWVVRYEFDGQPEIFALKAVCTHLGCTPNWLDGEQKFKCPCHGSGFYKDGVNFEGPAPRPLERYAIQLADDGQLEVDKSRKFQQELGQWNDPASFVPV